MAGLQDNHESGAPGRIPVGASADLDGRTSAVSPAEHRGPGQADSPKHGEAPGIGADEPRILVISEACTRPSDSSCQRCQIACPAHAISFGDDGLPRIDVRSCTSCGICVGICDGFGSSQVTTYDFAKRLQRKAQEGGAVYLCCAEDVFEGLDPAREVAVLECLASLPPELVTYLLASGVKVVLAHDLAYCENCKRGGVLGGRLWQRSFELASEWSGRQVDSADAIPEERHLSDELAVPDRRGLFTGVISAAGQVASGRYRQSKATATSDFLARRDKVRASMRTSVKSDVTLGDAETVARPVGSRRKLLAEALEADPTIASRIPQD